MVLCRDLLFLPQRYNFLPIPARNGLFFIIISSISVQAGLIHVLYKYAQQYHPQSLPGVLRLYSGQTKCALIFNSLFRQSFLSLNRNPELRSRLLTFGRTQASLPCFCVMLYLDDLCQRWISDQELGAVLHAAVDVDRPRQLDTYEAAADCLFPLWERHIPSKGTSHSHRGNIQFAPM